MIENPPFPEGVRPITIDELSALGVEDATGKLYWGRHELEIKKIVSLRRFELFLACCATISAVGVFVIELLKFICS